MKVPEPRRMTSGNWYINLRLGGQSINVTAPTATECRRQAELIKAEHRTGKRAASVSIPDRRLRDVLQEYVDVYGPALSPSTVPGYQSMINHRFQGWMDKPLKSIDWQRMINDEKKRCAPKTIKNAWGLVTAALGAAKIPVPEVKLPDVQTAPRPWLSRDEIFAFLDAIHGSGMEIPALMALLGLRRSEIVGVTWDRVDLKKALIRVDGAVVRNKDGTWVSKGDNKNEGSKRTVPIMIPELLDSLKAVPEEDRHGPVVRCHPNSIYKAINSACRKAGLPEVGVHGLRHSFASLGHSQGVPEKEMQIMGGWKDPGTMHRIYEHIEKAEIVRHENAMKDFYASRKKNKSAE